MIGARGRDGVTLVELLMVMTLVGALVSIAAPVLRPEGFQLNSASLTVASTLAAQQRTAVLRQHNIILAFDTVNGEIRIHQDMDNDEVIDSGELMGLVQLDEAIAFSRGGSTARPLGSDAVSMTNTQGGLPILTFGRNGSASEEAVIYLQSQRGKNSGGFANEGRAIEIERATARVRCYSHASGSWVQTC